MGPPNPSSQAEHEEADEHEVQCVGQMVQTMGLPLEAELKYPLEHWVQLKAALYPVAHCEQVTPLSHTLQRVLMAVLQELQMVLSLKKPVLQSTHPVPVYPRAQMVQVGTAYPIVQSVQAESVHWRQSFPLVLQAVQVKGLLDEIK